MIDERLANWDDAVWHQSKCRGALGPIYQEWAVKAAQAAGASEAMAEMFDLGFQIGVRVTKDEKVKAKLFLIDQAVIADIYRWVEAL